MIQYYYMIHCTRLRIVIYIGRVIKFLIRIFLINFFNYYYYYKCHGLECCQSHNCGAFYKNLDLKLLHSSMRDVQPLNFVRERFRRSRYMVQTM